MRAGIVGMGMIGAGIARSLRNSGMRAHAYDIDPAASERSADLTTIVATPRALARECDIVHLAVVDGGQARAALSGPDGVLAGAHAATVVLLLATLSLDEVHELHALGRESGVPVLDCGVIRGDLADRNGMVATMGGENAVVDSVRPTVEAWAARVVHCGPVGSGMAVKLGRNAVTFGMWRALEEATRTMLAAGVGEEEFIEVLTASDPMGESLFQQRRIIGDVPAGTPERHREVEHGRAIMSKDMAAVIDLAARGNVRIPLLDVVRREVDDSLDNYH